VSTAGVVEVARRRPVDILAELLTAQSQDKLKEFFSSYGPAEASAMCYSLVTSDPLAIPAVSDWIWQHQGSGGRCSVDLWVAVQNHHGYHICLFAAVLCQKQYAITA
jgi:hypothetical protein